MNYTTSRSRAESGLNCPRQRYFAYEYKGGLTPKGKSVPAATGIGLHAALAALLEGREDYVDIGLSEYHLNISDESKLAWEFNRTATIKEHAAFIAVAARVLLPRITALLRNNYEIVALEQAHKPLLCRNAQGDNIYWYSREDALLRDADGLWTFSFKTTGDFQPWNALVDGPRQMQNISEPWAAQHGVEEPIKGAVMVWFDLGKAKQVKEEGLIQRNSALVRPYFDGTKWYASYTYKNEQGKNVNVPRIASRTYVMDKMSEDNWVNMLESGAVRGFEQLLDSWYGPVAFPLASQAQRDSWLAQQIALERRRFDGALAAQAALDAGNFKSWLNVLDREWPQNTRQCDFCDFQPVCFGSGLVQLESLYITRKEKRRLDDEDEA